MEYQGMDDEQPADPFERIANSLEDLRELAFQVRTHAIQRRVFLYGERPAECENVAMTATSGGFISDTLEEINVIRAALRDAIAELQFTN